MTAKERELLRNFEQRVHGFKHIASLVDSKTERGQALRRISNGYDATYLGERINADWRTAPAPDPGPVVSKSVRRRLQYQRKSSEALRDVRIGLVDGSFLHFAEAQVTYVPDCAAPEHVVVGNRFSSIRLPYPDIDYIYPNWQLRREGGS